MHSITDTQRAFLSSVPNKASDIPFIVTEWRKEEHRAKLKEKVMYTTMLPDHIPG